MLPSLLSRHISQGLETFLRSTFSLAQGPFATMLENFLGERKAIKGPWVSLGLPFMVGEGNGKWFPELGLNFAPYRHQEMAFERLWQPDGHPKSTIVATGTGSGKTECFLYPILAHCLRAKEQGEAGIKAILIYPMNALATDQARRIAGIVHGSEHLTKAGVRAGLYVGGMEDGAQGTAVMGPDSIITSRDAMRDNPPDILLTNYKMLDLLLQRQEDIKLWACNDSDTLRYLVVDELHTFDGAQGTDLACLVRRPKMRLHTHKGQLACVGTSATLGSGKDAQKEGYELDDGILWQYMSYDILNMRCPVCGSDGFAGSNGFRAQVDADAYILRGGISELRVIDIAGHGDTTCLTCGYNGQIKDFCGETSA